MVLRGYEAAVDHIVHKFGPELRVTAPLGLGKPNHLLNALYRRVKADPSLELTLFTALSLTPPRPKGDLATRFFEPFANRQWGKNYPELEYARDARRDRLPPNVRVHEFYVQAGSALGSVSLQRDYQSINYTHVVPRLVDEDPQMVLQLVARDAQGNYSLSCNPDLTRDIVDRFAALGKPLDIIAVVHPDLPYLKGDAEVPESFFSAVVVGDEPPHKLFALPRAPVDAVEHAIGFHASRLAVDDGTLQLGIGSLSDALTAALVCRHTRNDLYREQLGELATPENSLPFVSGLHGLSEMVMDGFMHLRRAGILKRLTADGAYLTGAFLLGSEPFYQWLRDLEGDDYEGLHMGRISQVNHLFDIEPHSRRRDRKNARFFNCCMQATILGGAASETLADGRVVSGVGGQYNFVAMAHELPDARSVLMFRSTRTVKGERRSNVVFSHGHLTIPRHLRDTFVTEYGIADVRGRTDEETVLRMLAITDSAFQEELLDQAKKAGKVRATAELLPAGRNNTPERLEQWIARGRSKGLFQRFPFGSDFTPEEERLSFALERMKANPTVPLWLGRSLGADATQFQAELERMGLARPRNFKDRMSRRALLGALRE